MACTYLFYDTETSGLHTAFDQVLRFAAIRTDEELRELERHQIAVRLRADVIPSPAALLATGLSVDRLNEGLCEFEAIARIHRLFNTPETVTVGYNSLGFDDELLRFSFYRNLLTPYSHQHANGCGRMDILPMTVMVRLFRRHWLSWPEMDGKVNLKLENLKRENDLADGESHDAMVDVEATLELARRYKQEPTEWDWLTGLFDKAEDRKRQGFFPELCGGAEGDHRLALLAHSKIGSEDAYIAPVVSLGESIPYQRQYLWLRLDKTDFREVNTENVGEKTWAFRKRDGDDHLLLNMRPKYVRHLNADRQAMMRSNWRLLEGDPALLALITSYHRTFRYPVYPEVDADALLYADLPNRLEESWGTRFHAASDAERVALIGKMPTSRTAALAVRVLGRNYPEVLEGAAAAEFQAYLDRVHPASGLALVDYRGKPRFTPDEALKSIVALSADSTLTPQKRQILEGLKCYLGDRFGLAVVRGVAASPRL
jgi:exodeoxyribonuclease-1